MRRALIILLLVLMVFPVLGEEEETSYREAPPRAILNVAAPASGQTWESGGKLTVQAACEGAEEITATLKTEDGTETVLTCRAQS